jgi:hypothetical protein
MYCAILALQFARIRALIYTDLSLFDHHHFLFFVQVSDWGTPTAIILFPIYHLHRFHGRRAWRWRFWELFLPDRCAA